MAMEGLMDIGPMGAPPLVESHLLFFAVVPPPDVAARVERLATELKWAFALTGRLLKPENLHMTVEPFDLYETLKDEEVGLAKRLGDRVAAAPFEFVLSSAMSFRNRHRSPFVLRGAEGVEGYEALQRALWTAISPHFKGRLATPHMTLLYDRKQIPQVALDEPIRFPVEELVLIHSLYGSGRHNHLARWKLRG
jgi:2'-5' RNA ligase